MKITTSPSSLRKIIMTLDESVPGVYLDRELPEHMTAFREWIFAEAVWEGHARARSMRDIMISRLTDVNLFVICSKTFSSHKPSSQ